MAIKVGKIIYDDVRRYFGEKDKFLERRRSQFPTVDWSTLQAEWFQQHGLQRREGIRMEGQLEKLLRNPPPKLSERKPKSKKKKMRTGRHC